MFKTKIAKNGQYHFVLRAKNNKVILSSELYLQKASAEIGIRSVLTNGIIRSRFQERTSDDNQYYFVLRAANYKIIGTSEMYETVQSREKGIRSVITTLEDLIAEDSKPLKNEVKLKDCQCIEWCIGQDILKEEVKCRGLEKPSDWEDLPHKVTEEDLNELRENEVKAMEKAGDSLGFKYESQEDLAKKLIREPAEPIDTNWGSEDKNDELAKESEKEYSEEILKESPSEFMEDEVKAIKMSGMNIVTFSKEALEEIEIQKDSFKTHSEMRSEADHKQLDKEAKVRSQHNTGDLFIHAKCPSHEEVCEKQKQDIIEEFKIPAQILSEENTSYKSSKEAWDALCDSEKKMNKNLLKIVVIMAAAAAILAIALYFRDNV